MHATGISVRLLRLKVSHELCSAMEAKHKEVEPYILSDGLMDIKESIAQNSSGQTCAEFEKFLLQSSLFKQAPKEVFRVVLFRVNS